jgi:hypothetical protein
MWRVDVARHRRLKDRTCHGDSYLDVPFNGAALRSLDE